MQLTARDAAILHIIQTDFPISADPYAVIGAAAGCSREEAHATVVELRQRGIIRRIGGSFAAHKLGYVSTLMAAEVEPAELDAAAAAVSAFPEVTHNYERCGVYNLWFTVIAETPARIEEIIAFARALPGVRVARSMPASRTFAIGVNFDFTPEER